jgi:hypothetical protein
MLARVIGNVIVETFAGDLTDLYHPDFIAQLVDIDDNAMVGDLLSPEPIIEKSRDDLINEIYSAIDNYIVECIKTRGFDSLGSVALSLSHDDYKIEALAINNWIHSVWLIQDGIKDGSIRCHSVENAIASLPVFEILV